MSSFDPIAWLLALVMFCAAILMGWLWFTASAWENM
jgi:hypothetical protein